MSETNKLEEAQYEHRVDVFWPVKDWKPVALKKDPMEDYEPRQPIHPFVKSQTNMEEAKILEAAHVRMQQQRCAAKKIKSVLDALKMAFIEVLPNALQHGHGGDPNKKLTIEWGITDDKIEVRVTDSGPGFEVENILNIDCTDPEHLFLAGGRGLRLIQHYVGAVWNEKGNAVSFRKFFPPAGEEPEMVPVQQQVSDEDPNAEEDSTSLEEKADENGDDESPTVELPEGALDDPPTVFREGPPPVDHDAKTIVRNEPPAIPPKEEKKPEGE